MKISINRMGFAHIKRGEPLLFKNVSLCRMELTMQTNINEYDNRASWIPPQNQPYTSRFVTSQDGEPMFALPQNLAPTQRPTGHKPKAPEKMPKARAMALANKFKRGFAIASIVGFGAFGGLVALHHVGTTATQSSFGSSSSKSTNSSSSSSSQNSNSFLNQQGGNTNGTSSSSSSGSSTSSSSSSTVSGTHTS
jgi:hypothetical protein